MLPGAGLLLVAGSRNNLQATLRNNPEEQLHHEAPYNIFFYFPLFQLEMKLLMF